MVGARWNGEEYVFGYESQEPEVYDVGLNYQVGNKWPSKCWSMDKWERLKSDLSKDYSVSWQQGLNNMEQYFEWINSCRLLVTNDSFGLHLAIAMKKNVVGIFTSTTPYETHLYSRGTIIVSGDCGCPYIPCHKPVCQLGNKLCDPAYEDVYLAVCQILEDGCKLNTREFANKISGLVELPGGISMCRIQKSNSDLPV